MNYPFTVKKDLRLSVWRHEAPKMLAGESGTITGYVVADKVNPLYTVKTDGGKEFTCYHRQLVEVEALEPI